MECFPRLLSLYIIFRILVSVRSGTFSAISLSSYGQQLYLKLKNEGAPPSERDQAILDVHSPRRICEEITGSGFFQLMGLAPLDIEELYRERSLPQYSDVFRQVFNSRVSDNTLYEYKNVYQHREFILRRMWAGAGAGYRCKEHLLTCPVKNFLTKEIEPFYVSKEYNTGLPNQPYTPGRFLFPHAYDFVLLAEEPAVVYAEPNFNIELRYLRIRKFIQPAETNDFDPFCRLVSARFRDLRNQHHRICAAVSRSTSLRDSFTYPDPLLSSACRVELVSFKTADGIEESTGQSYYERMTRCYSTTERVNGRRDFLYVSRAYRSTQVFVYRRLASDGNIYLENLSTGVKIDDKLNSFDFLEN